MKAIFECGRVWRGEKRAHLILGLDFLTFEKIIFKLFRQKAALDYNEKLKQKFRHHPQVARIARHRHLPKVIFVS